MKKKDWKTLALMGMFTGFILSSPLAAVDSKNKNTNKSSETSSSIRAKPTAPDSQTASDKKDIADGNMGYHLMTEDELLMQLSPKGVKMYQSLDNEGKGLALLVASARCNSMNPCKGLNACQTEKNECAGKGSCKGQGKCATSDKDLAVKLVKDKMAQKRSRLK